MSSNLKNSKTNQRINLAFMKQTTAYLLLICLVSAMGGLLFGYDWVVIGGAKIFYELASTVPRNRPHLDIPGCSMYNIVCAASL